MTASRNHTPISALLVIGEFGSPKQIAQAAAGEAASSLAANAAPASHREPAERFHGAPFIFLRNQLPYSSEPDAEANEPGADHQIPPAALLAEHPHAPRAEPQHERDRHRDEQQMDVLEAHRLLTAFALKCGCGRDS